MPKTLTKTLTDELKKHIPKIRFYEGGEIQCIGVIMPSIGIAFNIKNADPELDWGYRQFALKDLNKMSISKAVEIVAKEIVADKEYGYGKTTS